MNPKRNENLKKYPKGVSGNPKGGSKKAAERKASKSRLDAIRAQVFGKEGAPERNLSAAVLVDGFNASKEELLKLMQHSNIPLGVRAILKEMAQNPDFALRIYTTLFGKDQPQKIEHTGKDGAPLSTPPITIEIIDSRDQIDKCANNENSDNEDIQGD